MQTTPLPTPEQIRELYPISRETALFIQSARSQACRIMQGTDGRKALIVGPCSIHDRASAIEYGRRFKELSNAVRETCFLVMRVYLEKPRTSTGWKGLLYDPHLDGSHDIQTGLLWSRELLSTLAEMGVPCATEFVDPLAALYFEDLITWGFIGARTSASQPHRQFASQLHIPIGFKNSTDGNLKSAVLGVKSAFSPHSSLNIDIHGKICAAQSSGNPLSHVVLRGACDFTNYDEPSVHAAVQKLEAEHLPTRLMIDCSHGNCQKRFERQVETFSAILGLLEEGNPHILGMMLESHIESGNQILTDDLDALQYAVSITDPCIDWKTTEELIYSADAAFSS